LICQKESDSRSGFTSNEHDRFMRARRFRRKDSDPAFIHPKTNLLQRILSLETNTARAQAVIHLVEVPYKAPAELSEEDADTAVVA
jgi:hypothetical protein